MIFSLDAYAQKNPLATNGLGCALKRRLWLPFREVKTIKTVSAAAGYEVSHLSECKLQSLTLGN